MKIKRISILVLILLVIMIVIICLRILTNRPPKLKDIKTVRVVYDSRLSEVFSFTSPLEINDTEQIQKLMDCFNVESSYGIGCDCPSDDIMIYFISEKREYIYTIGITGDQRIQYTKVPDQDIFGINIDDVIDILNDNTGSENLKYPYSEY